MKKKKEPNLICKSAIKSMGWSDQMIKDLLPQPITQPNPYHRYWAPLKLWPEDVVIRKMKTKAFINAKEKNETRVKAAKKAVETKRSATMKLADEMINQIRFDWVTEEQLRKDAIEKKYCFEYEKAKRRNDYETISILDPWKASEDAIKRWMFNYARHQLTNYDKIWPRYKGRVGCEKAYRMTKDYINKKIIEHYPNLKEAEKRNDYCKGF